VGAGCDIEENHFVRALFIVPDGQLHGIADIPQFTGLRFAKLDPACDLAVVNVKARDYALREHPFPLVESSLERPQKSKSGMIIWKILESPGCRHRPHFMRREAILQRSSWRHATIEFKRIQKISFIPPATLKFRRVYKTV
jgi:hypothetical protein